jgi:hypothetical protein
MAVSSPNSHTPMTPTALRATCQTGRLMAHVIFWSGFESRYGDVWVMQVDGSHPPQLTQTPAPLNSDNPHWPVDGRRILFVSHRGGNGVIYYRQPKGHGQTE